MFAHLSALDGLIKENDCGFRFIDVSVDVIESKSFILFLFYHFIDIFI